MRARVVGDSVGVVVVVVDILFTPIIYSKKKIGVSRGLHYQADFQNFTTF